MTGLGHLCRQPLQNKGAVDALRALLDYKSASMRRGDEGTEERVETAITERCRYADEPMYFLFWTQRNPVALMFSRCWIIRARSIHTHVHRLNAVEYSDIEHFAKILPPNAILSTLPPTSLVQDDLAPYNNDWMGKYTGRATTVLKPRTTLEVSDILKWCCHRRIGVVPQGGNTGLVGGSVPLHDELIVNLSNLRKIRSFDPISGHSPDIHASPRQCRLILPSPCRNTRRRCRLCLAVPDRLHCASSLHHAP
jgi:hypothetical protein